MIIDLLLIFIVLDDFKQSENYAACYTVIVALRWYNRWPEKGIITVENNDEENFLDSLCVNFV